MLDWRTDTFLDVCKTLNYTHTAKRLSITQPAVSQHIAWLEQQIGAKLFERKGRTISLTQAGELAYHVLQSQRNDEIHLREEIAALTSSQFSLTIGATLTAGEYLLAAPLARWCAAHPSIDVRVIVEDTAHLLAQLDTGELDCALVEGIFDSSRYTWKCWSHERMICVKGTPATKESAKKPDKAPKTFRNLLHQTLLIREVGSGSRAILEAALARQNLTPSSFDRTIEVKSLGMAREMAASGLGITFAYEPAVASSIKAGLLYEIPLQEEGLEHDICFVWPRDTFFAKRYKTLFSELKELA